MLNFLSLLCSVAIIATLIASAWPILSHLRVVVVP